LSPEETLLFLQEFKAAVYGNGDPVWLAREIDQRLTERTLPAERDLVRHMDRIIRLMLKLEAPQRSAIQRCVDQMCYGMPHFQNLTSLRGLARSSDMDRYCYYVAGVVGEMLTELFCANDAVTARQRPALRALAASFAQGLQMTNILKDQWEDRTRGACWLPQDVFARHGVDLATLAPVPHDPGFAAGLQELIALAHAHLRNALAYTLLIPANQVGIRRFCLWAIGLAVLTLRKINANPRFTAGAQVKVTRRAVFWTQVLTGLAVRNDRMLIRLFERAARGLPLAPAADMAHPAQAAPDPGGQREATTRFEPSAHREAAAPPARPRRRSDGSAAP
jgi:farnesyl-diphosphate farnesyltransferase